MALKDTVKPTRMELIEIKKRQKLSERGHQLLKMKRDGLIMEFRTMLDRARDARATVVAAYREAERKIAVAKAVEGVIGVKSAAMGLKDVPTVTLHSKNVMGVVVPKVEGKSVAKGVVERGYGIIGTSNRIHEAAKAYEDLVGAVISAAEVETSIRKLLDEIEKTKRRVNALEFRVIPELQEAAAYIRLRLEEMERENIFRLKRIKGAEET